MAPISGGTGLIPISGSAGLIPISGGNAPVPVVPIVPVFGGGTQVPALVEDLGQSALPKPASVPELPATAEGAGQVSAVDMGCDKALPNVEQAYFPSEKLTNYALNPNHPVGCHKAKVFQSVLGYNLSNADDLRAQVYAKLPYSEAILGELDEYGQRYTVDLLITGPNGNTAIVRTGWIIKPNSDVPQLTTIYVK